MLKVRCLLMVFATAVLEQLMDIVSSPFSTLHNSLNVQDKFSQINLVINVASLHRNYKGESDLVDSAI